MKRLLCALLCLALLAGCATTTQSSTPEPDPEPEVVLPTTIKLSALTLDMVVGGEDQTLSFSVLPEAAFVDSFTWSSSDDKVATVSEDGRVHAVGEGNAPCA